MRSRPARSKISYEISTDSQRFDVALIHEFLRASYWAGGRSRKVVEKSIRHSLCFGVFVKSRQVGFARVITDRATFAYIADVFVVPDERNRGVGQALLRAIFRHPDLKSLKRWLLATRDAHAFYAKFGFKPLEFTERYMNLRKP
jgi:N-acetylglutamate synthase-like GNAT family acetyltransferase